MIDKRVDSLETCSLFFFFSLFLLLRFEIDRIDRSIRRALKIRDASRPRDERETTKTGRKRPGRVCLGNRADALPFIPPFSRLYSEIDTPPRSRLET